MKTTIPILMLLGLLAMPFRSAAEHVGGGNCPLPVGYVSRPFGHFAYESWLSSSGIVTQTISGYAKRAGGEVVIPSMIEGQPVDEIGDGAFAGCERITGVVIPGTVISIGSSYGRSCDAGAPSSAFAGCRRLKAVVLGNGVQSIRSTAFQDCSALEEIVIPASVRSMGTSVFHRCTSLQAIRVDQDNAVYRSVDGVIFSASGTKLIAFPAGRTGDYAVPEGTQVIASETTSKRSPFGGGVTTLYGAFDDCHGLTGVHLPASLESIEALAFQGCSNLASIEVESSNAHFSSILGVLFDKSGTSLVRVPEGYRGELFLPASVDTLAGGSLAGCAGLTRIDVDPANPYFRSIDGILYDKDVTRIVHFPAAWDGTYRVPSGVVPVYLGSGVTAIEVDPEHPNFSSVDGILYDKTGTSLIRCPAGRSGRLVIPEGVESIAYGALFGCAKLSSILLPASLTALDSTIDAKLGGVSRLTAIEVAPGNPSFRSIDGVLFDHSGRQLLDVPDGLSGTYSIPAGVISIEASAFSHCQQLTSVEIPGSVATIGAEAFRGCTTLSDLRIPAGVTNVRVAAFQDCSNLRSVTFGATLGELGGGAFAGCDNLAVVNFEGARPAAPTTWDASWDVFEGAFSATVYYLPGEAGWTSGDGAPAADFGSAPAKPWLPALADVGINEDGAFGFDVVWAGGREVTVEASTTMEAGTWIPIGSLVTTDEGVRFSDESPRMRQRFFRVVGH